MTDSVLQVNLIKNKGGTATGITIDNSNSDVTINRPLTASSGIANAGTITAGTIGGGVSMASSGVTVRNITQVALASDQLEQSSTNHITIFSPTYTPLFSGSKVQGLLFLMSSFEAATTNARKSLQLEFTGSGITDITINNSNTQNVGNYDFGNTGVVGQSSYLVGSPLLATSSTATITCNVKLANMQNASSSYHFTRGNNTMEETHMTWIEYK